MMLFHNFLIIFILSLLDDTSADHSVTNELMHTIWAFGQIYPDYFHSPGSGIEAGTAQNGRYYQPDEIKYHGSGINVNRGVTNINFFGMFNYHYMFTVICACSVFMGG